MNTDNCHMLGLPALSLSLALLVALLLELHDFLARLPRNNRGGYCQQPTDGRV